VHRHPYEEILLEIRQPQQYIGCEWNVPEPDRNLPRVTLIYPDVYELGMSNFGLAVVRHVLGESGEFDVRRAFCPSPDMDALLESRCLDWVDMEAGDPVRESRVLGFGIPGEALYSNYLHLLTRASIPLRAIHRSESHPIVLAGGVGISNPLPLAPFTDLFFLGEAEEQIVGLLKIISGGGSREERLRASARIPGVWVPSRGQYPVEIQRVRELRTEWAPVRQVVPLARISQDRAVVEVARGCSRGCRFCSATQLARPVRERSASDSLEILEKAVLCTGWEKAGLLTLSLSDHSEVSELIAGAESVSRSLKVNVGRPSLRPDTFCRLTATSITGRVTIAPEAGSESLRSRINKPLSDEDILNTAEKAFQLGAKGMKLYFIVGLPGETDEDLAAIASLAARISKIARNYGRRSRKDITVALSPFVPKPHTPLQWAPQLPLEEIRRRLSLVRKACRRVNVSWNDPRLAVLEAVLGLGDGVLTADILEKAVLAGARFDAWNDLIRWDIWQTLLDEHPGVLGKIIAGLDSREVLPWNFVSTGVNPEWLESEYSRYHEGVPSPDCREAGCAGCGACNGEPVSRRDRSSSTPIEHIPRRVDVRSILRIEFSKTGYARFSSHLDVVRLWIRTVRRAGLPVSYSKGYVTRPRLHFGPPLPLGYESTTECLDVLLTTEPDSIASMRESLDSSLPEGFSVTGIQLLPADTRPPDKGVVMAGYIICGVEGSGEIADRISREPGVISSDPDGSDMIRLRVEFAASDARPDRILDRLEIPYRIIRRTELSGNME